MSTKKILHHFEENLHCVSSLKKMPKRMSEKEFKSFVNNNLNSLISLGGSEQELSKVLENKIPSKLENLLKSIIDCQELLGNDIENEYSKQFNDIKEITDKQIQFRKMQELLASILNNGNLRNSIENGLWEAYFETQKMFEPSKAIQESMTNYLYQVQADPIKRAYYIMFTALFELYATEKYVESKGNVNLDKSLDNTDEQSDKSSNGVAEYYKHLRGVPFPAP